MASERKELSTTPKEQKQKPFSRKVGKLRELKLSEGLSYSRTICLAQIDPDDDSDTEDNKNDKIFKYFKQPLPEIQCEVAAFELQDRIGEIIYGDSFPKMRARCGISQDKEGTVSRKITDFALLDEKPSCLSDEMTFGMGITSFLSFFLRNLDFREENVFVVEKTINSQKGGLYSFNKSSKAHFIICCDFELTFSVSFIVNELDITSRALNNLPQFKFNRCTNNYSCSKQMREEINLTILFFLILPEIYFTDFLSQCLDTAMFKTISQKLFNERDKLKTPAFKEENFQAFFNREDIASIAKQIAQTASRQFNSKNNKSTDEIKELTNTTIKNFETLQQEFKKIQSSKVTVENQLSMNGLFSESKKQNTEELDLNSIYEL